MHTRWVTFDCFGTLVDWNTGFSRLLAPLFGLQTPTVMRAYHQFERALEAERPHRLYRDVLSAALSRAAAAPGLSISESEARTLPEGCCACMDAIMVKQRLNAAKRLMPTQLGRFCGFIEH